MDPVPDPLLLRKSGNAGDRTRDLCICSQKLWPLDHRCTYIVFNNLKFTLKHLKRSYMFGSYDHPQGAYFVPCYSYSLKHSVIYFVILIWCCGSVSCVMRPSYAVQLRPALDVLVVPYSVSRTLYGTRRTSVARLILNSVQLSQYTRHAATVPN